MANIVKINGKDIKDVEARQDISDLKSQINGLETDLYIEQQIPIDVTAITWLKGYVKYADGSIQEASGNYRYSSEIDISGASTVTYGNLQAIMAGYTYLAAYNQNHEYIQSASKPFSSGKQSGTYNVPDGVKFIRVTGTWADNVSCPVTLVKIEKISEASLCVREPANAGEEGQVLSLDDQGNTVWINAPIPQNANEAETVRFGNWTSVIRDEEDATIPIENSEITAPIANAIRAEILSIKGTADGSAPIGFTAYTKNLLNPALVCACPSNQSAGYQVNIATPSTALLSDNNDGTFDIEFALGWSNGLMMSVPLSVGETYEIYSELGSSDGCAFALYTLSATYVVVRKLAYVAASQRKMYRVKLDAGEKYIAISFGSVSNTVVKTLPVSYPEIRVSETKNPDTTIVQENTVSNAYWYQPYKKATLTFDVASIMALFPGFGQANGDKANVLYPGQKSAFQYGYYSDGTWTDDVRKIDLSEAIADSGIELFPNGTLIMTYDGQTVPEWTGEYILTISAPYTGYVWTGLGDSLTAGGDRNGTWGFYRQFVKNALGLFKYNDCGVGTSALSGVGTYKAFWTDERVETLPLDSDVITVMGGTNDTSQLDAETNPGDMRAGFGEATMQNHDCRTFIGAYNVLISKILYKFMLSDGYYEDVDYTELARVETAKPWFRLVLIAPPPVLTNASTIEAMTKIAECVHKVGALWGLPVVDAHDNLGINDINKDSFFTVDYVHPNEEAHKRLANLIVAKAREIE